MRAGFFNYKQKKMKEAAINTYNKNKTTIIWIVVIVVLLIIASIYFYHRGKKTVTIQNVPGDLPGSTSPNNNPAGESNSVLKQLVEALHSDMDGYNILGHNLDPYVQFLALSDTDFVKVYNAFNTIYQQDSGQTLTGWINSEDFAVTDVPDAVRSRLAKLNLP